MTAAPLFQEPVATVLAREANEAEAVAEAQEAASPFGTPKGDDIKRDRWQRPLIIPPSGGEAVPYTRVSTFAKALDDGTGLKDWASAMTLLGAAKNETLVRSALGLTWGDDKKRLRELIERAQTIGGARDAADEGTTLHKHTERIDMGQPLPDGLDELTVRDLQAYASVMAGLRTVAAETFVVCDELQVAGTFDRLLQVVDGPPWLQGRTVIADLKTGSVDYAIASFAVQLACYAHGQLYDAATGARTPTGADLTTGLVIHLPQRQGRAAVYAINLSAGWEAAKLSKDVRAWRKRARLSNSKYQSDVAQEIRTTA